MSEKKIEVGSVVRLKSGGPEMTVTILPGGVDGDGIKVPEGEVECLWFTPAGTAMQHDVVAIWNRNSDCINIPIAALTHVR